MSAPDTADMLDVPPRQRRYAAERVRGGIAQLYGVSADDVTFDWSSDWSVTVHVRCPWEVDRLMHMVIERDHDAEQQQAEGRDAARWSPETVG